MANCPSKNKQKICKHEWKEIMENNLLVENVCKKCNLIIDLRPAYIRLIKAIHGIKEEKNV